MTKFIRKTLSIQVIYIELDRLLAEEATSGTVATIGVAIQTLEQNTHRLCWCLPGQKIPDFID